MDFGVLGSLAMSELSGADLSNNEEFEQKVLKASGPVLVHFWANWSGPSRQVAPVLDEIANERIGKITVAKVNVDNNPGTTQKYGVLGIPTLIIFKNGHRVSTKIGSLPRNRLDEWIDSAIAAPASSPLITDWERLFPEAHAKLQSLISGTSSDTWKDRLLAFHLLATKSSLNSAAPGVPQQCRGGRLTSVDHSGVASRVDTLGNRLGHALAITTRTFPRKTHLTDAGNALKEWLGLHPEILA